MNKRSSLLIGVAFSVAAQAQQTPDAGSLLQQIQRATPNTLPDTFQHPKVLPAPAEKLAPAGVSIEIKRFEFVGNTLLNDESLNAALKPWIGRQGDFNELKRAAQAVAEAYREAGWIVRAYLPKQDVTNGTVIIQIVEGVFGKTRLEGNPPSRLGFEVASRMIDAAQEHGKPLSSEAVGRAVLLVGDLPGVVPSASLKAGERDGETDLLLKLREGPLVSGNVGADNSGSRSTGAARLTGNLALNDPLGIGDQFQTSVIHSEGSDYGLLDYSLPIGANGFRLGASASALKYDLVGSDFSALNASGKSNTVSLKLRYPLILAAQRRLYATLFIDRKRFDNQANQATVSHYGVNDLSLLFNGNNYDGFYGGGVTSALLNLTHGNLDLNGSPNQAADAATTKAEGSYNKLQYSLSRYQTINQTLNFYASLTGQAANKNLDSSEKFYLGGANGVRAYPTNEGGGSSGQLVNLELKQRIISGLSLNAFYDWGHVTVNEKNNFASAAAVNSYDLQGYGLGVEWASVYGANLKAQWARRIGSNPNPSANGTDQDGSLKRNRFWLSLSVPFGFDFPETQASRPAIAAVAAPPFSSRAKEEKKVAAMPTESRPSAESQAIAAARNDTIARINETIERWRNAWARADIQSYLAAYGEDFCPTGGLTRSQWKAQREQRIRNAKSIRLDISTPQVVLNGDTATAHFFQRYHAANYADSVEKSLGMKLYGKQWKIVSEQQSPTTSGIEPIRQAKSGPSEHEETIKAVIEQWEKNWSNGDVQAYLNHYAKSFRPANGLSYTAWQAQRQQRIKNAGKIKLELCDQQIEDHGDTVEVRFVQHYRASNYSDSVRKVLTLQRQGSEWLIVSERQQAVR